MNKNKWTALLVLAVFLVSVVPFAAADEASVEVEASAEAETQLMTKRVGEKFDEARDERIENAKAKRTELQAKRTEARAKVETKRGEIKKRFEELREAKKMRKELYKDLKEKRVELKQQREEKRAALGDQREKLRTCKGSDSEDCELSRKEARANAAGFLTRAAEHILALLEQAKERVENSDLSDAEKAKLIEGIDANLAEVDAALQAISGLGENATKEDLKEATQIIRDAWQDSKKGIKHGVGKVASKRIGGVIVKMERLSAKFDRVIARLEAAGKDTGAAEAKKMDFDAKLEAAASFHEEATKLFESGDHAAAAEKIRAAHAELKAAHEILKGIVQEIRGIGGSKDLEEEAEESEEETETQETAATEESETADDTADAEESDADDSADESEAEESDEAAEDETSAEASTETSVGVTTGSEGTSADVSTETNVTVSV